MVAGASPGHSIIVAFPGQCQGSDQCQESDAPVPGSLSDCAFYFAARNAATSRRAPLRQWWCSSARLRAIRRRRWHRGRRRARRRRGRRWLCPVRQAVGLHGLLWRWRRCGWRGWRRRRGRRCAGASAPVAVDAVDRRRRCCIHAGWRYHRLGSQRAAGGKQQKRESGINGFHERLLG